MGIVEKLNLKHKDYLSEDDFVESDLIFYQPPTIEELGKAGILGNGD